MKPAVSERVLRAVAILVGACNLKTARKIMLFSCPVAAGGSSELAVVIEFDSLETALLWVGGLA